MDALNSSLLAEHCAVMIMSFSKYEMIALALELEVLSKEDYDKLLVDLFVEGIINDYMEDEYAAGCIFETADYGMYLDVCNKIGIVPVTHIEYKTNRNNAT